ncbi:MAG: GtrA family protein [Lachnospiraceae bacterium]|nr:GtrA family protein [Lachnospiraceae bacterium]
MLSKTKNRKNKTIKYLCQFQMFLSYGFFGILSTAINIALYSFLVHVVKLDFLISNGLAWTGAFLFAYYTNSKFVFGYKPFTSSKSLTRFIKFLQGRIFTGFLDMFLMWFMVKKLFLNDTSSKIVVNILVILLNYIISKLFIFKGEHK